MSRRDGKTRTRQVRALLLDWDAIGVADTSPDEYDCMIGPLLRQLHDGTDAAALTRWIDAERAEHFGLDPDLSADRKLAGRLLTWWLGARPR